MRLLTTLIVCSLTGASVFAIDPCVSGVPIGQRPGPYTFIVSTGKERGRLTCYICDTADRPAFVVFARTLSPELGTLTRELDKIAANPKNAPLRGWVTFLSNDQVKFDSALVGWGKKHAVQTLPLGVFEDADGPPSYRLAADADVTVLLFVKQKVIANFAYRANELNESARQEILKAVPKLLETK
jgi:hypothetical protein